PRHPAHAHPFPTRRSSDLDSEAYPVGGKTGTAEKTGGGGYRRKALLSSFVGAFPIDDPRYVVFAMLDEPQGRKETFGYATGGWVDRKSTRLNSSHVKISYA